MPDIQCFDEMWTADGTIRHTYQNFLNWFEQEDPKRLSRKQSETEELFRLTGITFNVYGREEAEERLIPFDIIPRIISARDWRKITRGIEQRVRAINAFLHDIYHRQEILRANRIPKNLISENAAFLPQMIGVSPPCDIYTHIVGVDLVRTDQGEFYVLEDNARTPSGVSYMLENRETMLQMFPELFSQINVRPVQTYPIDLLRSLASSTPSAISSKPTVAVLTPGIYNSAYFEHSFLADEMGIELVEKQDLRVIDGHLAMRTIQGYKRIDVIYRRIDDEYLDPLNFNPESQIGVTGIFDVYRAGHLTIANAPGTGIADDKAIYSYMPEIIKFYTGEQPLLKNVPTWRCIEKDSLSYVLDHLPELVVKEVHGSGGYGMLIGPTSNKREIEDFKNKLKAQPGNYIAQPTLALSTVPILAESGLSPRHVDLRPFVLVSTQGITVTPGGLTRVALEKGSLVVNSSQGGGTKDTWVLEE
ncbi:MAG: circularly permuted type 2 ATP-grasp protein [Aestuariivita sp.]|nr:circularly permuted type 2 ATP-grasp protein [Aestuariivita sp.]